MLGMAIGDAIGARVEFSPLSYNYNEIKDMGMHPAGRFKLRPGQWTDDTSMGLCIADSLIENKKEFNPRDIMMRFILWWNCGYNNAFRFDDNRFRKHSVGLGGNIGGSLKTYIKAKGGKTPYTEYGDRNTSGNGSIMRNAAIPICYFREGKEALKYAKNQSLITHQGDEAAGCCQLMTFIILKILKSKTEQYENEIFLKNILENLEDFKCDYETVNNLAYSKKEGDDQNKIWNWKDPNFKYNEKRAKMQPGYIGSYCMDGLAMALHKLYTTESFEKAILEGVNLCGDADSVGSVIGQIAGAFYGLDSIPKEWIKTINKWDNSEIALRGYILCNLKKKINK
jgi:ADP-ribosylglycohydrolase